MRVHLISIGGSIMHNIAIALHKKGYLVSGSDDEIFEPAKSRLMSYGLLPSHMGWDADKITPEIDVVILGMHAKEDNPELQKALTLGLKIYSFPEFIYENNSGKQRVVIGGSHGKTTITSMVMHVLSKLGKDFDYLVGSTIKGFDDSVRLSENAPLIVMEGDEYLTSTLDRRPKFLWYKPQIALLSGIAWDHMNVFPTFEIYIKQFEDFLESMPDGASLVYTGEDELLCNVVSRYNHISKKAYHTPEFKLIDGQFQIAAGNGTVYKMSVFGSHNLLNIEGAKEVCKLLGIHEDQYYTAISDFSGAGKRLELQYKSEDLIVFRDFAHSPSKVKATIEGVKQQYPGKKLVACLELHTYSSMNKDFLPQYRGCVDEADVMLLLINPEELKLKRLPEIDKNDIKDGFNNDKMEVFYDVKELEKALLVNSFDNTILLLMSSGNYAGWDIAGLPNRIKARLG